MGQDRDLHTHIEGLDESMKLVLVVLNIARVENTWIIKQNIETRGTSISAENPKNDDSPLEFGNESMKKELNENLVIGDREGEGGKQLG